MVKRTRCSGMEQKTSDKRKPLEFTTKGPFPVYLDDDKPDQRAGCNILDISFPEPVTIGELLFRNYYTASIRVLCRKVPLDKDVRNRDTLSWQMCIKHFLLMPNPHCEQSSQDFFSVPLSLSLTPLSGIVSLRFVLKQPCGYWRKFGIDEITIHRDSPADQPAAVYVPRMFSSKIATSPAHVEGKDEISSNLLKLKHTIELMKSVHTNATIGRFEIDGSYDVSHLI